MREAGLLKMMMGVIEEELRHVVWARSVPSPDRQASRWDKERGYLVIYDQRCRSHAREFVINRWTR